jgi:hypothetical protein
VVAQVQQRVQRPAHQLSASRNEASESA